MNPSNSTVFRFIATYGKGFDQLVQRLILGYGYKSDGGLSHKNLVRLYLGTGRDFTGKLYAGYFMVEPTGIRIFSGVSETLFIPESEEKNRKLMEDLRHREGMSRSIVSMFPLITTGLVQHVMIAP